MKKSTKMWIKQKIAVLLVVLISINSFAAVVGDSDGVAFITKSEFETMKSDFDTQLERYNASLDSKIDGVIASFLAGQSIGNKILLPQMNNYNTIRWMHGPYMYFTNRRFTEFSSTEGKYVDTVGWQILKPENRRQTASDAYAWCYDFLRDNFNSYHVAFMLYPKGNVTKQWGIAYGSSSKRWGPTIYIECEKIDGEWVLTDASRVIVGEASYTNYLWANPHGLSAITNRFSWSGEKKLLSRERGGVMTYTDIGNSNDIVGYRISSISCTDGSWASFDSHITIAGNPNWPQSNETNLDQPRNALRVACGDCGFGLSTSMYIDDGLIEDNRWKTSSQKDKDDANMRYSLFGADVDDNIKVNFGPKKKYASTGYYLDLSESGNSTSYDAKMTSVNIVNTVPWSNDNPHSSWIYENSSRDSTFTITVPLFYRMSYGDIRNRAHRTLDGEYLKKKDGYPIVDEAPGNGTLRLRIDYEEKVDVDTSVVTSITRDQKIKTYFKNKRFSDNTGVFYEGYTNLDGTGSLTNLNGTEWTSKMVTVNIPVKKGEAVWMRIDPLTEDGVFCVMNNIQAQFIEE